MDTHTDTHTHTLSLTRTRYVNGVEEVIAPFGLGCDVETDAELVVDEDEAVAHLRVEVGRL